MDRLLSQPCEVGKVNEPPIYSCILLKCVFPLPLSGQGFFLAFAEGGDNAIRCIYGPY